MQTTDLCKYIYLLFILVSWVLVATREILTQAWELLAAVDVILAPWSEIEPVTTRHWELGVFSQSTTREVPRLWLLRLPCNLAAVPLLAMVTESYLLRDPGDTLILAPEEAHLHLSYRPLNILKPPVTQYNSSPFLNYFFLRVFPHSEVYTY